MEALFQKIEIDQNKLFIVKNQEVESFTNLFHFHPEYELTFIKKGHGECLIGNEITSFSPGDLFLFGHNLPHSWKSIPLQQEKSHSVVIQLNSDLWNGGFTDGVELKRLKGLLWMSCRGIKYCKLSNTEFEKSIDTITTTSSISGLMEIFHLLDKLSKLTNHQLIVKQGYSPNLKKDTYNRLNSICFFVSENYQRPISLSDVASQVNMTSHAFCRFFKRIARKTFVEYLNEYRVEMACRLLSESDFSISEIGFKCGYNSLSNFNNQFNRITKTNPTRYRLKVKEFN